MLALGDYTGLRKTERGNLSRFGGKYIQAITGDSHSLPSGTSAGSLPFQERSEKMGKRARSITDSKEKEKSVDLEVDSGIGKTGVFDSAPMAKRSRSITESKKEKADTSVDSIVEMDNGKTTCSNSVSSEMVGSVVLRKSNVPYGTRSPSFSIRCTVIRWKLQLWTWRNSQIGSSGSRVFCTLGCLGPLDGNFWSTMDRPRQDECK